MENIYGIKSKKVSSKTGIEFWWFIVYLVFVFLNPQNIFTALRPFRLALIVATITFLICILKARRVEKILFYTQTKLLLILMFLFTFSTIFSINFMNSLNYWTLQLKVVLLYFMFLYVAKNFETLNKLIWAMLFLLFIDALISVLMQRTGAIGWRLVSFDGEGGSNDFALMLISLIPFGIHFIQTESSRAKKILSIIFTFIFLIALTRTRSRMGGLALILLLVQFLWINRKNTLILILMGCLVAITLANTHYRFFDRMQSIRESRAKESRIHLWKQSLEVIKLKPVLGVGPGNFVMAKHKFAIEGDPIHVTHNSFLEVGAENGLLAMSVFMALFVVSLKNLIVAEKKFKSSNNKEMLGLCLSLRMAFSTLSFSMIFLSQQYNHFYYIFCAMAAKMNYFADIELEKKI